MAIQYFNDGRSRNSKSKLKLDENNFKGNYREASQPKPQKEERRGTILGKLFSNFDVWWIGRGIMWIEILLILIVLYRNF